MTSLSASTRVAAVIGDPVAHSLSPAIHNAAFEAAGLDWAYCAFTVPAGGAAGAVTAMRALRIAGMSVTMPHKEAVADAVDEVSEVARLLGAVNCVSWAGDRLVGHNTDGEGLVAGLAHDGVEVAGRRCVVIGAGGAARSVVHALGAHGAAEITVVARRADRAERAAALAPGARSEVAASAAVIGPADLVVNATPVGMVGGPGGVPCDPGVVAPGAVAVDLVYHPLVTPWLADLADRGVRTLGGIGMLVGQAALAFELWTGAPAPVAAMRDGVRAELARRNGA